LTRLAELAGLRRLPRRLASVPLRRLSACPPGSGSESTHLL